jgi:hypothetical protein
VERAILVVDDEECSGAPLMLRVPQEADYANARRRQNGLEALTLRDAFASLSSMVITTSSCPRWMVLAPWREARGGNARGTTTLYVTAYDHPDVDKPPSKGCYTRKTIYGRGSCEEKVSSLLKAPPWFFF